MKLPEGAALTSGLYQVVVILTSHDLTRVRGLLIHQ